MQAISRYKYVTYVEFVTIGKQTIWSIDSRSIAIPIVDALKVLTT